MELAAIIVSVIALGVSTYYAWRDRNLATRLADIEEERRAEELASRASADLVASFDWDYDNRGKKRTRFIITNVGRARATDVTWDIAVIGTGAAPIFVRHATSDPPAPFEQSITSLDPGQDFVYPVFLVLGVAEQVEVTLKWNDEAGDNSKTMTLGTFVG